MVRDLSRRHFLKLTGASVAVIGSGVRRGDAMLSASVLLVMLGHRSIPLTYFNDLVLVGVLLGSMYSKPVYLLAAKRAERVATEPSLSAQ